MRSRWFSIGTALALLCGLAQASMGLSQIPASAGDGPVTVYYPSSEPSRLLQRGLVVLDVAAEAAPTRGNGRLIVISHGSGGAPWVHANLARSLVEAGFVVAMPEHHADNYRDESDPGPDSWTIRPAEVSRAIDAVGRDPRFAPLLALDKVGMYGMSAGGHTALSLAGGRWSPALFRDHCVADIAEDFQSCVGLITHQTGSVFDALRRTVARAVIRLRFGDDRLRSDNDPRIVAVVAGVPAAADFDMASLVTPRVPLGLVTARQDLWLVPRFHSDRVLRACTTCEHIADLPSAGHGALLSPPPPHLGGLIGHLLNDPPGFDRSTMAEVDRKIVAFFERHVLAPVPTAQLSGSPRT